MCVLYYPFCLCKLQFPNKLMMHEASFPSSLYMSPAGCLSKPPRICNCCRLWRFFHSPYFTPFCSVPEPSHVFLICLNTQVLVSSPPICCLHLSSVFSLIPHLLPSPPPPSLTLPTQSVTPFSSLPAATPLCNSPPLLTIITKFVFYVSISTPLGFFIFLFFVCFFPYQILKFFLLICLFVFTVFVPMRKVRPHYFNFSFSFSQPSPSSDFSTPVLCFPERYN